MSGFRFLPLGVGDAFSALHYSSCLALEAEGQWLLVDCPHPIRKILRESSATAGLTLDIDRFLGVVLTHLHADHCSGLEIFGFYMKYVVGKPAPLLAHPEVSEHLWHGHLSGGMERALQTVGQPPVVRKLEDFFQLIPLSETAPVQFGPFSILCKKTIHMVPTTGLRIRAGGRSLGYSADTAFDPTLIDWLTSADSIIHETNPGMLHTPYENLIALPAGIKSKMRVIHYQDTFDVEKSAIEPLRQGKMYAV